MFVCRTSTDSTIIGEQTQKAQQSVSHSTKHVHSINKCFTARQFKNRVEPARKAPKNRGETHVTTPGGSHKKAPYIDSTHTILPQNKGFGSGRAWDRVRHAAARHHLKHGHRGLLATLATQASKNGTKRYLNERAVRTC